MSCCSGCVGLFKARTPRKVSRCDSTRSTSANFRTPAPLPLPQDVVAHIDETGGSAISPRGQVEETPSGAYASAQILLSRAVSAVVSRKGSKTVGDPDAYYKGAYDQANDGMLSCHGFVTRNEMTENTESMIIVLVGLPGRGKSFISRKLEGFCKWQCKRTKTFNAGKYRRDAESATQSGRADFFRFSNEVAQQVRKQAAMACLHDLLDFLDAGGEVAIFDATNSTRERRQLVVDEIRARNPHYRPVFVEVLCDDREVLDTNIRNKVRYSPDFSGMTMEEAIKDLQERIKLYEDRYETIEDDAQSYIKLYNMSSKVMVNRIYGSVAKSLLPYLMGIHIGTRPIWLVRTARVESESHPDAELTQEGVVFAERLASFVRRRVNEFHGARLPHKPVKVFSSTVTSCLRTVEAFLESSNFKSQAIHQTSSLNPIDRGRMAGPWWVDSCTDKPAFDAARRLDPVWTARWEANKLYCRFPGGESYHDVMLRSEPVLLEMEMTTRPVLCVAHITCIQVLLSYFLGTEVEDAWGLSIPEHQIFEITPTLGGSYRVETVNIDAEPVLPMSATPSREKNGNTVKRY